MFRPKFSISKEFGLFPQSAFHSNLHFTPVYSDRLINLLFNKSAIYIYLLRIRKGFQKGWPLQVPIPFPLKQWDYCIFCITCLSCPVKTIAKCRSTLTKKYYWQWLYSRNTFISLVKLPTLIFNTCHPLAPKIDWIEGRLMNLHSI